MSELSALRQVLALAETGNYRRAAAVLGISHSALSQTIARLEERYGVPLFIREGRRTVPTAFGRRLVDGAVGAVAEMDKVARDISSMRSFEAGRIVLGADPNISESVLGPVLAEMVRSYPKLQFRLRASDWRTMERGLRSGAIDLFLGLPPERIPPGIEALDLPLPPPTVACRAGHPLASEKTLSALQIFDYPVVGGDVPDWFLVRIRKAFPEDFGSIEDLRRIFLVTQDLGLQRLLLRTTDAVGLIPRVLVRRAIDRGEIVELAIDRSLVGETVPCIIARDERRPMAPAALRLREMLQELVASAFSASVPFPSTKGNA